MHGSESASFPPTVYDSLAHHDRVNRRHLWQGGVSLMTTGLVLTGCGITGLKNTENEPRFVDPPAAASSSIAPEIPPDPLEKTAAIDRLSGAGAGDISCIRPIDLGVQALRLAAQRCEALTDSPDIALVIFGKPMVDGSVLADAMSQELSTATAGHVTPTITPMAASPAAVALHKSGLAESDCQDAATLEHQAAYAADVAMELADYDKIVAISDVATCQDSYDGYVNDIGGRYADLNGSRIDARYADLVRTAMYADRGAHEVGHQLGLRHKRLNTLHSRMIDIARTIAIGDYAHPTHIQEYAHGDDVMGSSTEAVTVMNGPQLECITWPQQVLHDDPDPGRRLSGGSAAISAHQAQEGQYISLPLIEPVMLEYTDATEVYDTLAVAPEYDTPGRDAGLTGYELLLTRDNGCEVISLGDVTVSEYPEYSQRTIVDGDEAFAVNVTRDTLTVTAAQ